MATPETTGTQTTGILDPQSAQAATILAGSVCLFCNGSIADHINENGTYTCKEPVTGKMRQFRRTTDRLLFVPVIALSEVTGRLGTVGTPARKRAKPAKKTATARKRSIVKESKEHTGGRPASGKTNHVNANDRGRGRTAGVYMGTKRAPKKVTESIDRVYKQIMAHKHGMAVKNIAAKLNMPSGTVGWAVQKLVKQRAVRYVPMAAA